MKIISKLLSLLIILTVSCSMAKQFNISKNDISLPARKANLKNLTLKTNIFSSFYGEANSVVSNIDIAGVDSLSMSIIGPFGIAIGKLFSNQNYFLFYSPMNNLAYEGNPSADNFKQVINIPLSFEEFLRLLRNETPGSPDKFELLPKESESGKILFKNFSDKEYVEYALISEKDNTIKQYQRKLRDGTLILNVYYEDYENTDGFLLPGKIVFNFPNIDANLTFDVTNIRINNIISAPFSFNIPGGIERIQLGN